MTMQSAITRSQASESSDEAICRPCGVIIQASRRASTSGEFSDKVISGSRRRPLGEANGFSGSHDGEIIAHVVLNLFTNYFNVATDVDIEVLARGSDSCSSGVVPLVMPHVVRSHV
jgi:hypothetical protein